MNYIHIMTVNVSQNILNIARSHDPNPWAPLVYSGPRGRAILLVVSDLIYGLEPKMN